MYLGLVATLGYLCEGYFNNSNITDFLLAQIILSPEEF